MNVGLCLCVHKFLHCSQTVQFLLNDGSDKGENPVVANRWHFVTTATWIYGYYSLCLFVSKDKLLDYLYLKFFSIRLAPLPWINVLFSQFSIIRVILEECTSDLNSDL